MTWLIGILGVLIGYIFTLKGKLSSDDGIVTNLETQQKITPIQQNIDINNSELAQQQQALQKQEEGVKNESLQDASNYFNTELKP